MTSLHDRLADLADLADLAEAAPAGPPFGPGEQDLWERGRRYGRRRRVEAAALTLVLLAAVGSLLGALVPTVSYDVGPADAEASLHLPDRLEAPSPWTKGTDDVGPIGPVVAVFAASRSAGLVPRTDTRLVGVSASGDYAFLDLPGVAQVPAAQSGGIALSADGRRVAYPLTGETAWEPSTAEGEPVVGLAVYDTVTGDVERLDVPSDHGLALDDLAWVGDTVRFSYGRYVGGSGEPDDGLATGIADYTWDVTESPARAVRLPEGSWRATGTTADGRVVESSGRRVRVSRGDAGAAPVELRLDALPEAGVRPSPSGVRLALLEDTDGANQSDGSATHPVRFAIVPESGSGAVETIAVPDAKASELWGWRDDQHVVVQAPGSDRLVSVDVNTGARERLVRLPSRDETSALTIAQDALQAPTFHAEPPPYVMAPWLRATLLGAGVLLAGLALLLWRRRGRV